MYFMDLLYFTVEDTTNHSIKLAEQVSRIVSHTEEYNNRLPLACVMIFSKSFKFLSGFCSSEVMMFKFLQRA